MELGGEPDAVEPDGTREKSKNHSYDIFLGRQFSRGAPDEVILDFDATELPTHGDRDCGSSSTDTAAITAIRPSSVATTRCSFSFARRVSMLLPAAKRF